MACQDFIATASPVSFWQLLHQKPHHTSFLLDSLEVLLPYNSACCVSTDSEMSSSSLKIIFDRNRYFLPFSYDSIYLPLRGLDLWDPSSVSLTFRIVLRILYPFLFQRHLPPFPGVSSEASVSF